MKAILVINMPNDADISKVRTGGDGNIYYMRDGERASIVGNIKNIKPLPQKMPRNELGNMSLYKSGWNACLDEITGKKEDCRNCQEWESCSCGK